MITEKLRNHRNGKAAVSGYVDETYVNNLIEQDHRGPKQRCYPMRAFGSVPSAERFLRAFDELRNFLRPTKRGERISLSERRKRLLDNLALLDELLAA